MEKVKQFFIDNPGSQECWYDRLGNVIHYNHPLFTNHISRVEAENLPVEQPVESKKKITGPVNQDTNI